MSVKGVDRRARPRVMLARGGGWEVLPRRCLRIATRPDVGHVGLNSLARGATCSTFGVMSASRRPNIHDSPPTTIC